MQGLNLNGQGPSIWTRPERRNGQQPDFPDLPGPSPLRPISNAPGLSQQEWPSLASPPVGGGGSPYQPLQHAPSTMHPAHALLSESGPAHSFTPPLDSPSTSAALDKFAPVYVPLWLRQIAAAAPARIIRHPPAFAQDGHDFAKAIFPKTLYETIRLEKHQAEKQVLSNVNLNLDHLEKLENTHLEPRYASKLLSLQIKEFQARKLDLAASTLYNVAIRAADTEMEGPHSYNLFKLEAPEIREGYPMLEVNDVVFLRHLQYGQNGVSWNGIVMLAEVRAIKRAQALIIIRCNALHGIIPKNGAESFIVGFEPQGM